MSLRDDDAIAMRERAREHLEKARANTFVPEWIRLPEIDINIEANKSEQLARYAQMARANITSAIEDEQTAIWLRADYVCAVCVAYEYNGFRTDVAYQYLMQSDQYGNGLSLKTLQRDHVIARIFGPDERHQGRYVNWHRACYELARAHLEYKSGEPPNNKQQWLELREMSHEIAAEFVTAPVEAIFAALANTRPAAPAIGRLITDERTGLRYWEAAVEFNAKGKPYTRSDGSKAQAITFDKIAAELAAYGKRGVIRVELPELSDDDQSEEDTELPHDAASEDAQQRELSSATGVVSRAAGHDIGQARAVPLFDLGD